MSFYPYPAVSATPPEKSLERLRVGERSALLYSPSARPERLLFFFHGSQQSAQLARRFTGYAFEYLAQRTNSALIYPNGVHHHFNDGRRILPEKTRSLGIDDCGFALALSEIVGERFPSLRENIGMGYSNGGHMVMRVCHQQPGFFSAAVVFAASMPAENNRIPEMRVDNYVPVPVLSFHGSRDPYAPFGGGAVGITPETARGECLSALENAQYFAELNGAHGPIVETPTRAPYLAQFDYQAPEQVADEMRIHRWEAAAPVELIEVRGMGHVIPGTTDLPERLGPGCVSVSAADEVQRFLGL